MPLPKRNLIPGILILLAMISLAAPPLWWSQGNPPVVTGVAENNKGPANIGQAKNMVAAALQALATRAPTIATQVRADLAISHPDLLTVPSPKPADWAEKQKAPLLLGQLKAIALPFYNCLNTLDKQWVRGQIELNLAPTPILSPSPNANFWQVAGNTAYTQNGYYPWNPASSPDINKSIATIGQLKAVFSLRFETLDTDDDGLADSWEIQYFSNLAQTATGDTDDDGLTNLQESLSKSNPRANDSDGDGMPDGLELEAGYSITDSDENHNGELDGYEDDDDDGFVNFTEVLSRTNPRVGTLRPDGITTQTLLVTSLSNGSGLSASAQASFAPTAIPAEGPVNNAPVIALAETESYGVHGLPEPTISHSLLTNSFSIQFQKKKAYVAKVGFSGLIAEPYSDDDGKIVGEGYKRYLHSKTEINSRESLFEESSSWKSSSESSYLPVVEADPNNHLRTLLYNTESTSEDRREYTRADLDSPLSFITQTKYGATDKFDGTYTSSEWFYAERLDWRGITKWTYPEDGWPYNETTIYKIDGWSWPEMTSTQHNEVIVSPTRYFNEYESIGNQAATYSLEQGEYSTEYTDSQLKSDAKEVIAGLSYSDPYYLWEPCWSKYSYWLGRDSLQIEDLRYTLKTSVNEGVSRVVFLWREVTVPDPSPYSEPIQSSEPVENELWKNETVTVGTVVPPLTSPPWAKTEEHELLHPEKGGISYPAGKSAVHLAAPAVVAVDHDTAPVDLVPSNLSSIFFNVGVDLNKQVVTLVTTGSGELRLWKRSKRTSIDSNGAPKTTHEYEEKFFPYTLKAEEKSGEVSKGGDFFIQGKLPGNLRLSLMFGSVKLETADVRIIDLDLDIDSDNTGSITHSDQEDRVEAVVDKPGKIISPTSSDDADGDGTPNQSDPENAGVFTEITLKAVNLLPNEKIAFVYSGPDAIEEQVDGLGKRSFAPSGGQIRIWKRAGNVSRVVTDFIAPYTPYSLDELGIPASGTDTKFYVESLSSTSRITIKVDSATAHDIVTLLPVEIVPDYTRDGKIDQADSGKITTEKPWRFWINDDDDSGETGGTDIPVAYTNGGAQDLWQPGVDGIRDLIDFFPLHFDLKAALVVMPETEFQYFLKHDSMESSIGSSFSVLWYPEAILDRNPKDVTGAGSYLKNLTTAADIVARDLHPIPKYGLRIPNDVLLAAKNGKGVALFEARMATEKPIQIEIRKNDGTVLGKVDFPVKISPVQNMFRYKFVMPGAANLGAGDVPADPPNWPDADRNDKHFVFAHGYNVNDTQSKGWGGEAFKRLFWSGSNARFTAFGWYGYQGQTFGITPDYQVNLDNAFGTAKSFKQFLDLLEGEKTVAAHSMGNVLVGSAMHDWGARPKNYFMVNAAAAKECYDPAEADEPAQDAAMENQIWRGYPKELRASEWHRLHPAAAWPGSDWRGKLTWRGRFANVIQNGGQTDVYNFYSSGEEVLNNAKLDTPLTNNAITEAWLKPNRVWAVQEKRKGHGVTGYIHTSNYGGWRFNLMTAYDPVIHDISSGSILMKTPAQLPSPLSNAFLLHLASNPFFDRSAHSALYEPETGSHSSGSNYAYNNRNTIISEMIPCTSLAAGRNAITVLGDQNIDMDASMKTDAANWPLSNVHDLIDNRPRPWLHSDVREKAFTHNWKVYEKFTSLGNLKNTK